MKTVPVRKYPYAELNIPSIKVQVGFFNIIADEAILTALEMIRELKVLNEGFKKVGFPQINIGIGINTGEAITGNKYKV